jgi:16S rRNA processing protein RimM
VADTQAADGWIAVGQVAGVFGPRGEIKVRPLGRFPQRFRELRHVYVGEEHRPAVVLQRRLGDKSVVLRLDMLTSREAARDLIGTYLYVPESEAIQLPKGEYFVHQIVGLDVVTAEGEALGSIADVLQTGSNDVYVVQGPRGEVLVPALKDVIQNIDLDAGTMTVALPPGLVD